jgi:hypothetical protein
MIQKLILLIYLSLPLYGLSGLKESYPSVWVIKDSLSKSIHQDSVRLVFNVTDHYNQLMLDQHPAIIQVKIDGKMKKYTITDKKRTFKFSLLRGKHSLSFFLNANFEELHFEKELTGGHYYEIGLNFKESYSSGRQIMVEKPVIYLYSETEQAFTLKIRTDAELQFTYPSYKDEWKGTVSKSGMQINGTNYPYLFWDAQLPAERLKLNWEDADQLIGEQTTAYLSAHLDHLGFNAKEKADFITYWGPRMQKMNYVEVLWIQNEAIQDIATLEISNGFTQNRVYIIFKEISDLKDEALPLKLTKLKPLNRTNNYLVEWGGIEIQSNL